MDLLLTDEEVRILGCLLEKEMATPAYYPLSLNSLTSACNQKSNRTPVVAYSEDTIVQALKGLQERKLARQSNLSRVPKFEQLFSDSLNLIPREKAVICTLLVRGPQTIGEIRNRTERLYQFNNLEEVQETLASLEELKLIARLARQPGQKEIRYVHLLSGDPQALEETDRHGEAAPVLVRRKNDQIAEVQRQIDELRREMDELKQVFQEFRSQFD